MSQSTQPTEESRATLVDEDDARNTATIEAAFGSVDESLRTENDVTVLKGQLSSDQLVSDLDIIKTNLLVQEGREEDAEAYGDDADTASAVVPYTSFDVWEIIKKSSINLFLPFVNGFMLGFGEILAHEVGFRYNWFGAKVSPPRRMERRRVPQSQYL